MRLPFTHEQFIDVFATYNTAVWPAQVAAYVMAAAMLLAMRSGGFSRSISAGLSAMWLWTGMAYHWSFFAEVNPAALLFAVLFVLQGLVLFHVGVLRGNLRFEPGLTPGKILGWCLILYATLIYPLLCLAAGFQYPGMPTFGITPCSLTIFTLGMLLLARRPVSSWLLVIPVLWSLVGGSAALLLRVHPDLALLVSGLATLPIVLAGRHGHGALQSHPTAPT